MIDNHEHPLGEEDLGDQTEIRQLKQVQQMLQNRNAILRDIIDSIPAGVAIFQLSPEAVKVIAVNTTLIGFAERVHEKKGEGHASWNKSMLEQIFSKDIYAFAEDEDKHLIHDMLDRGLEQELTSCEFRLAGTAGTAGKHEVWIRSRCMTKVMSEQQRTVYVLFADVTDEVEGKQKLNRQRESLEYLSYFDTLTGVHNRNAYMKMLDQYKKKCCMNAGVIFADVNGLKEINDRYGHIYGDKAISDVAIVMTKYFPKDMIYRISGDEFVVLNPDISMEEFDEKVVEMTRELEQQEQASVGAMWEASIQDMRHAILKGEQLMYIQKQRYYTRHREKNSRHRPGILNTLLEDIRDGRYLVYLQPKSKIEEQHVTGAEALIRKVDQDGNVVPPYEFVPLLERERLISKIDFFVLEEVCKMLQRWEAEHKRLIKISVNMSRITLAEDNYLEHVADICTRYKVHPQYLEFEITESMETKNDRLLQKIINTLTDGGFGISLDDMGSDYSSLRMLPINGIDTVKMDRSMILQMDTQEGYVMIKHVIAMCHELGEICIAEGVEEEAQREVLQQLGCDYYQGYLLNRPIPVEEFEGYL